MGVKGGSPATGFVDGQWINVCLKQLDKQEILYLIGALSPRELGSLYRRRWSIETAPADRLFQSLKKREFDI